MDMKRILCLLLLVLMASVGAFAQSAIRYAPVDVEEEDPDEFLIFEMVEMKPRFPGGEASMMQFISASIMYPTISMENDVQGRVFVQFVINRDGSIANVKVLRGVDPYLDKEAVRVVSTMPKWEPGMHRGKAVRVRYTVPITFRLDK
jgi:protein TonB